MHNYPRPHPHGRDPKHPSGKLTEAEWCLAVNYGTSHSGVGDAAQTLGSVSPSHSCFPPSVWYAKWSLPVYAPLALVQSSVRIQQLFQYFPGSQQDHWFSRASLSTGLVAASPSLKSKFASTLLGLNLGER